MKNRKKSTCLGAHVAPHGTKSLPLFMARLCSSLEKNVRHENSQAVRSPSPSSRDASFVKITLLFFTKALKGSAADFRTCFCPFFDELASGTGRRVATVEERGWVWELTFSEEMAGEAEVFASLWITGFPKSSQKKQDSGLKDWIIRVKKYIYQDLQYQNDRVRQGGHSQKADSHSQQGVISSTLSALFVSPFSFFARPAFGSGKLCLRYVIPEK